MKNFTVQIMKAAVLTLFAVAYITAHAEGKKRIVQVQKAKKQVVLADAKSDVTPQPLKVRPNNAAQASATYL